ncbi:hypothetical protein PVL29_017319 [Vitis rotundifolia]|uniref:NAD-dependent epimerase/dehydratase domain-containing protein n=1 Tax=Vitis rotundifolia TaxID=103349 RepID=A0AA38ZAY2_VITRO|nr:hypothetical protein PVL29_017319 [Vitis rotundifolia]
MSVAVAEKVVCVTEGAGYIASWLVKLLLLRGYTVKATLRNPAKERLRLFKANLLEEGSFDSIVEGCEGVFHTASPVLLEVTYPKVELIDPAVKGTLNVLRSCAKVLAIRRMVVTSSIVAVVYNGKPLTSDVIVDETWFSDPAFCEESKLCYVLSKTLVEEAAWKFAREHGIDLVTMNPGVMIGPLLQPTINLTMEIILNMINAFEISSASGRYCMVERVTYRFEAIKILHELYPASTFLRMKSLAIDFIPLEVSLKDTIESLKEKNFINL